MSADQLILVPRISTLPDPATRGRALLNWLVKQEVVAALPSTCGLGGNGMAYAIGPGARRVVRHPERLPYGEAVNGLEIIDKRCIYTPTAGFLEEAGCPECRQEIGEALFDSLEEWFPARTDNFICPECGHEDDINGFLFLQPCAFSNLGFIFNGWADAVFTEAFLTAFAERLGFALAVVRVQR